MFYFGFASILLIFSLRRSPDWSILITSVKPISANRHGLAREYPLVTLTHETVMHDYLLNRLLIKTAWLHTQLTIAVSVNKNCKIMIMCQFFLSQFFMVSIRLLKLKLMTSSDVNTFTLTMLNIMILGILGSCQQMCQEFFHGKILSVKLKLITDGKKLNAII